jgi:hypothetical protein
MTGAMASIPSAPLLPSSVASVGSSESRSACRAVCAEECDCEGGAEAGRPVAGRGLFGGRTCTQRAWCLGGAVRKPRWEQRPHPETGTTKQEGGDHTRCTRLLCPPSISPKADAGRTSPSPRTGDAALKSTRRLLVMAWSSRRTGHKDTSGTRGLGMARGSVGVQGW